MLTRVGMGRGMGGWDVGAGEGGEILIYAGLVAPPPFFRPVTDSLPHPITRCSRYRDLSILDT